MANSSSKCRRPAVFLSRHCSLMRQIAKPHRRPKAQRLSVRCGMINARPISAGQRRVGRRSGNVMMARPVGRRSGGGRYFCSSGRGVRLDRTSRSWLSSSPSRLIEISILDDEVMPINRSPSSSRPGGMAAHGFSVGQDHRDLVWPRDAAGDFIVECCTRRGGLVKKKAAISENNSRAPFDERRSSSAGSIGGFAIVPPM